MFIPDQQQKIFELQAPRGRPEKIVKFSQFCTDLCGRSPRRLGFQFLHIKSPLENGNAQAYGLTKYFHVALHKIELSL